jgi:hypothetical protein
MCYYWIICIFIVINCVNSSNISGLCVIFSNNCKFIRNNRGLSETVVLLDNCKMTLILIIPQYIQQLTQKLSYIPCQIYQHLISCILLINMAPNMHIVYRMENKPILNLRGV